MPLTSASTLVGFPDAKSTGLPDGVTLTASGDVNVTKAGTVIDALDVKGTIWVMAPNVTIQNSRITSTEWTGIWIKPGITGTVVKDNEILNVGSSKDGANGIFGSGTFLRNDIHDVENGINVTGASLIQDNYIHDMHAPNVRVGTVWGGPHYDGIEINGGVSGVDIRHNTIINENGQTSAVMINNDFGPVSDIQVDGNYLAGGGYTLYSDGSFSSTDKISGVEFTNNELGQGYWGYYYFKGNTPVLSGNDEIGTEWPTPVSTGGTPVPEPTPTIAMFSTDSGTLGDGLTNDNTLTLSGTAAANSAVKVFEGTTQVRETTANGSGAWSVTTSALADGSHSFTAAATSGGTTSASSSPLTVRVDTVAPNAPTIASFSTDTGTVGDRITSDNTLSLTGAAAANSAVKVYDGAMLLGSAPASGSGVWSYTTGVLSNAPHSLTARATDAAGNTSMASSILTITVDSDGSGSTPANHAPVVTPSSQPLAHGATSVAASSLFQVSDADNDRIIAYRFWDGTTDSSSGHFELNGSPVAQTPQSFELTAAQLPGLTYEPGSVSDQLWFRAFDGQTWSDWKIGTVNPPANHAPVVTPSSQPLAHGATSVAASSLFQVSDADNDRIIAYRFWDGTTDSSSGHFELNGSPVAQTPQSFELTAAQLPGLTYEPGSVSDQLWFRAFDGQTWSDWKIGTVNPPANHAPVVTPSSQPLAHGATSVAASSLFQVSDADNDRIIAYRFWDGTTDSSSGHFELNGSPVAQTPQSFELTAAQLPGLTYEPGSVSDQLWFRAFDGQTWSDWQSFQV